VSSSVPRGATPSATSPRSRSAHATVGDAEAGERALSRARELTAPAAVAPRLAALYDGS
jgi:hypothetical protein